MPFGGLLRLGHQTLLSSSPELFLTADAEGRCESRPIKGTRPRAPEGTPDARQKADLAASDKDQAENNMIVDLVRNDLGRVCAWGSVEVSRVREIESFATVHQMVSTVRGQLSQGRAGWDLVAAAFPGGSMTGAPKIQALRLLAGLESRARGIYSGGFGFFDDRGGVCLAMVIRALVMAPAFREGGMHETFGIGRRASVAPSSRTRPLRVSSLKPR